MRHSPLLLCITSVLAGFGRAQAQDCTKADVPFKEAQKAFKEKEFQKAFEKYEEAYELCWVSVFLYSKARALQAMHRNAEALCMLRSFQASAKRRKDAEREFTDSASKQIAELEGKVGRAGSRCDQNGSAIVIDGHEAGKTPLKETVPFKHEVTVKRQNNDAANPLDVGPRRVKVVELEFGKGSKAEDGTPIPKPTDPVEGKKQNGEVKGAAPPAPAKPLLVERLVTPPIPPPTPRPDLATKPFWCVEREEYDCEDRQSLKQGGGNERVCQSRCVAWGSRPPASVIVTLTAIAGVLVYIVSYYCYKDFCRKKQYPSNSMGTQSIGN
jgi:hypothetical protein